MAITLLVIVIAAIAGHAAGGQRGSPGPGVQPTQVQGIHGARIVSTATAVVTPRG